MPKPKDLSPVDLELERIRVEGFRRKRENRLRTLQFFKTERDAFGREDYGEWLDQLINDRLLVRRHAIINAYDTMQYRKSVHEWYRKNGFTDPPKHPHGKRIASPWKALAAYKARWKDANPDVPTTPPPPVLTATQIDYHEQLFRKRYKERTGKK